MTPNEQILRWFAYDHLPETVGFDVSAPMFHLAHLMNQRLPDGDEKITGLRKLLEAKDCFVRAKVAADLAGDAG